MSRPCEICGKEIDTDAQTWWLATVTVPASVVKLDGAPAQKKYRAFCCDCLDRASGKNFLEWLALPLRPRWGVCEYCENGDALVYLELIHRMGQGYFYFCRACAHAIMGRDFIEKHMEKTG